MTTPDRRTEDHSWEWVPGLLALLVTLLVALATATPYFYPIHKDNMNLITQAQTTLWNGWMVVLTYYFGSTKNQTKAQDTMNRQARLASDALAASVPTPDPVEVKPAPGQGVKVEDGPSS